MYAAWRDKGAIGPCEQREVRRGFEMLPTHLLPTLRYYLLTYCLLLLTRCGRAASMRCAGGASRRVLARSSSR